MCFREWAGVGSSLYAAVVDLGERERGGGGRLLAVLYASFHGWEKMESPQWLLPSAQGSQWRETLGTEKVKERKRVKEKVWESRGREGLGGHHCHHMGWIKPQLADFIRPLPPTLPITPSVPFSLFPLSERLCYHLLFFYQFDFCFYEVLHKCHSFVLMQTFLVKKKCMRSSGWDLKKSLQQTWWLNAIVTQVLIKFHLFMTMASYLVDYYLGWLCFKTSNVNYLNGRTLGFDICCV